jgi:hypothetical protein
LGEADGEKVSVHGDVVCSREIEAIAFPAQAAKLPRELDLKNNRLRLATGVRADALNDFRCCIILFGVPRSPDLARHASDGSGDC